MNRRSFIGKMVAAAAAVAVPMPHLVPRTQTFVPSQQTLEDCGFVGDGFHDDTRAVQMALDQGIPFNGRRFAISGTIVMRQFSMIRNCWIQWIGPQEIDRYFADTVLYVFPVFPELVRVPAGVTHFMFSSNILKSGNVWLEVKEKWA